MVFYDRDVSYFVLTYGRDEKGRLETARVSFVYSDGGTGEDVSAAYTSVGTYLIDYLNRKSLFLIRLPQGMLQFSEKNVTLCNTAEQLERFNRYLPTPQEYEKLSEFVNLHLSEKPPRDTWVFPEDIEYTCVTRLKKMGDGHAEYQKIFSRAYDLLACEAAELYVSGTIVRKCKNCGQYFLQKTVKDEVYCDNIYKNGKTCKQLGYVNTLTEFDLLYRTAYKTKFAWVKNHPGLSWSQAAFEIWQRAAKQQKQRCESREITLEEYKRFLKIPLSEISN